MREGEEEGGRGGGREEEEEGRSGVRKEGSEHMKDTYGPKM